MEEWYRREVRGSARCAESVAAEGKWRPLNGGGAPSWGQPVVSDLGSSLRSHSTVHRALTTFSFPLKKYPHINNISHTINVSWTFMAVRNTSSSSDYSVSTVTLRRSGSARFTMTLDAKARALMKGKGWSLNQTTECAVVTWRIRIRTDGITGEVKKTVIYLLRKGLWLTHSLTHWVTHDINYDALLDVWPHQTTFLLKYLVLKPLE